MKIAPFELERYFARWEFETPHVLCASDVEGWPMSELLALADDETRALWDRLTLGYTESLGHPLLRAEIAKLYETAKPEDIIVFSGAEEAIFAAMNVMLAPGDRAVVTWPGYQSLYEVARTTGADVDLLPLVEEDGWALDLTKLRRSLSDRTRAIVVNFPHNPTGALPSAEEWSELISLARGCGCPLFSDEVYRGLEIDRAPLPTAFDAYEHGISLGVMSKTFALAGLRIGWIATRDRGLQERLAAFKDYLTICSPGPSEILAVVALRARESVVRRSRSIIEHNLARLDRFFAENERRFAWVRPRGGSIGFPRLLGDVPVDAFAHQLRESEGVLLLPGSVFKAADHFRIGFGRRNLPEALERVERFVRRSPA